ncbi:MAG: redoxin domain-containing protein [Blastocatellales bacterium]|nr:redoxin domain-containing protein [Blastocatellales bacterium]
MHTLPNNRRRGALASGKRLLTPLLLVTTISLPVWPLCAGARSVFAVGQWQQPPPQTARDMMRRGMMLAERDRFDQSVVMLDRARKTAPHWIDAHREYIRVRADFQGRVNEVRAEYEALIEKDPANPVYPLALALAVRGRNEMSWLRRVAELAPDWSWGHYAQSFVLQGRTWETFNETYEGRGEPILAEALQAVALDPEVRDFYLRALRVQENLRKLDDAVRLAEQMAAQAALRAEALGRLWRLRLAEAKGSEQAKERLRAELQKLAGNSRDVKLLAAAREAYLALLKDQAGATVVEMRLRRIDPGWYPERGRTSFALSTNLTGQPYAVRTANRQTSIYEKLRQIVSRREADWRKESRMLEELFALGPNAALRKFITYILFNGARKAGDAAAVVKYGESLHAIDPYDTAPLAHIALATAGAPADAQRALEYARRAAAAVAEFRAMQCPADYPAEEFAAVFSIEKQRENHQRQQALAFEAEGWALNRLGRYQEAEASLRRAAALHRTESALERLAHTLQQLGQNPEAAQISRELDERLLADIKRQFVERPAPDFQLAALDGQRFRLSELKGKVVLVSFWATWCGPCIAEMPLLVKAYEKYRDRGFELLAVSVDDPADREQVRRFAVQHRLNFPVLYDDDDIARLYEAKGYPANMFIDRQGNIRWETGSFSDGGRRLELLLAEMLK